MVADEVDICSMFEEEVDYAVGDGSDWSPEVVFNASDQIVMWRAAAKRSGGGAGDAATTTGKYFKTLWFDDNLNGKIKDDATSATNRRPEPVSGTTANALHDLYNQNADAGNIEMIWEFLTDEDGDPNAGDLGKVDMVSANDPDTTVDESATNDNLIHPGRHGGQLRGGWRAGRRPQVLGSRWRRRRRRHHLRRGVDPRRRGHLRGRYLRLRDHPHGQHHVHLGRRRRHGRRAQRPAASAERLRRRRQPGQLPQVRGGVRICVS